MVLQALITAALVWTGYYLARQGEGWKKSVGGAVLALGALWIIAVAMDVPASGLVQVLVSILGILIINRQTKPTATD